MPLWTAGSQFPGLPLQQVLDKLEVSGRVSTFPRGGGSSIWFYTKCCETSGWRDDCASVFFPAFAFTKGPAAPSPSRRSSSRKLAVF